jgi:hypothetical protein
MQGIMQQLTTGSLGVATIVVWTLIAAVLAMAGGALAAVKLAGKDLGNPLAALMGMLFGPVAAVPGVLIGLIVLKLL